MKKFLIKKYDKDAIKQYAKYSVIPMQMVVLVVLGLFAGNWLDKKFETEKPYYTIILTFLGILISFYFIYKMITDEKNK